MTLEQRQELIARTVAFLKETKGQLSYDEMQDALLGKLPWTMEMYVVYFLAMSVISYNIPKFINKVEILRDLDRCFRDAITFLASNIAEKKIVHASRTGQLSGSLFGQQIINLSFYDDTHEFFTFGRGNQNPDLVDETGITYEVKLNYEGGSPSSLHKANFLLNCKTGTVEKYPVFCDAAHPTGYANIHYSPEERFRNVLSAKITAPCEEIAQLLGGWLDVIYSGELIKEVEANLKQDNFILYNN